MYRRPRPKCPYCRHLDPIRARMCRCQCHGGKMNNNRASRLALVRALDAYGGRCACCGETRSGLLSIDHIDGNGAADRETGSAVHRRLAREGFPPGYQVLCYNCNFAKSTGEACPCPHLVLTVAEERSKLEELQLGHVKGERAQGARLTQQQAEEIRQSTETQEALAARYSVSQTLISQVRRRVKYT